MSIKTLPPGCNSGGPATGLQLRPEQTMDTHNHQQVRVAVDAMGGDYAPAEVVKGAVQAARNGGVEIILVGPEERVREELAIHDITDLPLRVHHTNQFIADGEHPAAALRKKPQASVAVAARLVQEGQAEAAVSMGHTGAVMIAAHWILGSIEGIDRPVGGGVPFALAPRTVALDLGPNVDCKPRQFVQFAVLGVAYARCLLGLDSPTVALLANGSEEGKGNRQSREAYQLLQKSGLNFIGNVEGWDLLSDRANVIVCDGFVGNVLLKFGEGLGAALARWLRERLASLLPSTEIQRLTDELQEMMDIEKRFGGVPLLGVKGVMVVGHGRCRASGIEKAIGQARLAVESHLIETMEEELAKIR
ncbi:MAG TPA: phosphate acyltransferase PlsX [Anaerolineae bacterium]|nr:phosphate acyltransferase PlsX [Anaerolineae bacterium]